MSEWEPEPVWRPQPGPQSVLLESPCQRILFGGAAGGGKTDALIGDWLVHSEKSNGHANGILFRKSYPELTKIIQRTWEIYPAIGATWRAADKEWKFANGTRLALRYVESMADATRYQGHEYTWVGVDEIGEYPEPGPLDYISGRLRSPHGVKVRMVLTANPAGAGHHWIKTRYVDPAPPGTPFREQQTGEWCVFIPSKLRDNRVLMENDPGYADRLRGVGESWRVRAWLEGDWDASPGNKIFDWQWVRFYERRPEDVRRGLNVYVVVDPATSKKKGADYTAIWVIGLGSDRNYYVLDVVRDQLSLSERWKMLLELHKQWRPLAVGYEKYGMQSDLEYFRGEMERENYRFGLVELGGQVAKNDRVMRLEPSYRDGRWWFPMVIHRSMANGDNRREANLVEVFREELELFPNGAHDDMIDAQARILDDSLSAMFPMERISGKDYRPRRSSEGTWASR